MTSTPKWEGRNLGVQRAKRGWSPAARLAICALALMVVVGSCRSAPTDLYNPDDPATFPGCPYAPNDGLSRVTRSYAALLLSLKELRWSFDEISPPSREVIATACLRGHPGNCVTMSFLTLENGTVKAHVDPRAPVIRKMGGPVVRWMRHLDVKFKNYRCMMEDLVRAELTLHGIDATSFDQK